MALLAQSGRKNRLATLLTRSIFLTIGVLSMVMVFQNYQVNRQVVSHEVARSKLQTQSLVQQIFDFRMKTLEIQQDSYSRNESLIEAVMNQDIIGLDRFFNGTDQATPELAPDFRFITLDSEMIWDDSNYQFYGISPEHLAHLSEDMRAGSSWYLSQTPSLLGTRYLMARRAPIIQMETGEVIAFLHIAVVLNNNFALINAILKGSNADHVLLSVGSEVIASSTKNKDFRHIEWLEQSSNSLTANQFMVSKTDLTISNVSTFLSLYTLQDNEPVMTLVKSHYVWVGVAACLLVIIAVYSRLWLGQRVSSELNNLMKYTERSVEEDQVGHFCGSQIEEFNQIGHSFELAFLRLSDQEKQFADLFNFSLSPITLWNVDGHLVRSNPAAESSFRREPEHEQNDYQLLVEKLKPHILMCARGTTLTGINITIRSKTYRWNLSPIFIDSGINNIMAQGQDVTSFIEAEIQSYTARKEAEESARVRADFLAKMSHELRTPLNGILGVSQLLKRKLTHADNKEHVEVLCNSGEHLLAVLNDILDFSKIEQGKFHIQAADFRLIELVTAVEKIYSPLCREKGIELDVLSNVNSITFAHSDQVRLNQILFNLVSNAVKFTHHGKVTVSLMCGTQDDVSVLNIKVKDSGIGIDQERLVHIFEPFVQAESTTTREYGGSGLGLAIVHSLVEMLQGQIEIESAIGEGTTFTLVIPIELTESEEKIETSALEVDPASMFDTTLNVLLVEDNKTNAFIAKAFCEKYGMAVTWVEDGLNAIELLKASNNIDLILMDNQLPNLGGIETTKIIREDLKLKTPIFACTADGMQDTKRAFLSVGADYVIVKPIKELALNQAFLHFKHEFLT
ncbi:quorum-sensing autoinducer 2 sensor kinase/phosphatase LuxQ [Vibrio ostreicida]|uniref:Autoinducer 2 sensor kinase/phosphatase LuxQ n=1 Tax=Vibrio ostreicida TaxID=526588 RepID=A0ABT8BY47_9VIBR|nr:quorum-sensing autoinducer 2 sensor kinase/phosphatase LuxQ [Vibrio ostreicida]MDN3611578.1 LuxQ periplasmic sensor domain-containing protein [Vibrio ostreicida]NPD09070.1 response regulator [Vibrio ostreicida]